MAYIKNWRDVQPNISHLSAVHWGCLRSIKEGGDDDRHRLDRLGGFARHALQGRKTSDFHKHEALEQVYYILSGKGEVLFEDQRYPVEDGDAVYLPADIHHQMFNTMNEGWLEHHVISMGVPSRGGKFTIRNWTQTPPQGDGAGAVRWYQLEPENDSENGCLKGMQFIARESVQPGNESIERCHTDIEQVYYVIENRGVLQSDGKEQEITEGDMIHIPVGTTYKILNPHQEWVSSLIMAG